MTTLLNNQQRAEAAMQEHANYIMDSLRINGTADLVFHYGDSLSHQVGRGTVTGMYQRMGGHSLIHVDMTRSGDEILNTLAHELRHMHQVEHGFEEYIPARERRIEKFLARTEILDFIPTMEKYRQQLKYLDYYMSYEEVDARVYGAWYAGDGPGRGPYTLNVYELRQNPRYTKLPTWKLLQRRAEASEQFCKDFIYNDFIQEIR